MQQTPIDNNWATWANIRVFGPQSNIRHFKLTFCDNLWRNFWVFFFRSQMSVWTLIGLLFFFLRQTSDFYPEKERPPSFLNFNLVSSDFFLNYSEFSKQVPPFFLYDLFTSGALIPLWALKNLYEITPSYNVVFHIARSTYFTRLLLPNISIPKVFWAGLFSCPGQLNRWHCQWVIKSDFWFEQSRAEQSRAERSGAEQSGAEQSRAEQTVI